MGKSGDKAQKTTNDEHLEKLILANLSTSRWSQVGNISIKTRCCPIRVGQILKSMASSGIILSSKYNEMYCLKN